MTKLSLAGLPSLPVEFPIPKGYARLLNAMATVVGGHVHPGDEGYNAYVETMYAFWRDLWGSLISEGFACYAIQPGLGLKPMAGAAWTTRLSKGPPKIVCWEGSDLTPLVRLEDMPALTAIWRENKLYDGPKDVDVAPPA